MTEAGQSGQHVLVIDDEAHSAPNCGGPCRMWRSPTITELFRSGIVLESLLSRLGLPRFRGEVRSWD
jgi:hypothetical protein